MPVLEKNCLPLGFSSVWFSQTFIDGGILSVNSPNGAELVWVGTQSDP